MRIKGLAPTHYETQSGLGIPYAMHEGRWYFVSPFSFDGETWNWNESKDVHPKGLRELSDSQKKPRLEE